MSEFEKSLGDLANELENRLAVGEDKELWRNEKISQIKSILQSKGQSISTVLGKVRGSAGVQPHSTRPQDNSVSVSLRISISSDAINGQISALSGEYTGRVSLAASMGSTLMEIDAYSISDTRIEGFPKSVQEKDVDKELEKVILKVIDSMVNRKI